MDQNRATARTKATSATMLATIVFQSGLNYSREKMDDAAKAAYQRCVRDYPNTPAAVEARKLLGPLA